MGLGEEHQWASLHGRDSSVAQKGSIVGSGAASYRSRSVVYSGIRLRYTGFEEIDKLAQPERQGRSYFLENKMVWENI